MFDIDPLRIYEGFETPFGFFGLAPTLFDGPYRLDGNQHLDWLAHSFLCVSPSHPMERDVFAVLGFSWGFVLDNVHITMVEPKPLTTQDWAQHVEFLAGRFPSWTFIETESEI